MSRHGSELPSLYGFPEPDVEIEPDGSLYSRSFDDLYGSRAGKEEQAPYVFLEQNGLPERWQDGRTFTIGELGFGAGVNFLTVLREWKRAPGKLLHYIAFESSPLPGDLLRRFYSNTGLSAHGEELLEILPQPIRGFHRRHLLNSQIILTLIYGDARQTIKETQFEADCWFLDGFSPRKNPELWEEPLLLQVARRTKPGGTCSTYAAATTVGRTLERAQFYIERREGFAKKRELIFGRKKGIPPMAASAEKRVAIIGSGLAGASASYALTRRGVHCTVFEQHSSPATETSSNPFFSLVPHISTAPDRMTEYFLAGFLYSSELLSNANHQIAGFTRSGALIRLSDKRLQELAGRLESLLLPKTILSLATPEEAARLSGIPWKEKALHSSLGGYGEGSLLSSSLLRGAELRLGTPAAAEDLLPHFDAVISATGSAPVPPLPEIQPVRGQAITFGETDYSKRLKTVVSGSGYLTPATSGVHGAGATFNRGDRSTEIRSSDSAEILRDLCEFIPLPLETPSTGWAGIRAMSPDRLPIIGNSFSAEAVRGAYLPHLERITSEMEIPNHFLTLAHGSRGLSSTLIAGEILASMILREPAPIPLAVLDAVHPGRFLLRKLRKLSGS